MASYSSSLSVALTYLKEGPNSVACVCLTSPGLLCVIRIIITPLHNTVKKKTKSIVTAGNRRDKHLAAPFILVPSVTPIKQFIPLTLLADIRPVSHVALL